MKKIISAFLLMFFISSSSIAQTSIDFSKIPYNQKTHSIKSYSGAISGSYWVMLRLDRKQAKKIDKVVRAYYATTSCKERSPEHSHQFLGEKFKGILTVNQYTYYQSFQHFPEIFFAPGAPVS